MRCTNCEREIDVDSKFCFFCGQKIGSEGEKNEPNASNEKVISEQEKTTNESKLSEQKALKKKRDTKLTIIIMAAFVLVYLIYEVSSNIIYNNKVKKNDEIIEQGVIDLAKQAVNKNTLVPTSNMKKTWIGEYDEHHRFLVYISTNDDDEPEYYAIIRYYPNSDGGRVQELRHNFNMNKYHELNVSLSKHLVDWGECFGSCH